MSTSPPCRYEPVEEDTIRLNFIEMLFALAIAQVAITAADLANVASLSGELYAAIAHQLVGLFLISASWVGWRQSKSPGMRIRIKTVFSLTFIGLLLDVILVIVYFVIVRNSEVESVNGVIRLSSASAISESGWILVVFVIYFVWDLVTDVFPSGCIPNVLGWSRVWIVTKVSVACTMCSLICAALGVGIYLLAHHRASPISVVVLDFTLIILILIFRLLKAPVENRLRHSWELKGCRAFSEDRDRSRAELVALPLLLSLFAVAVLAVAMQPCLEHIVSGESPIAALTF